MPTFYEHQRVGIRHMRGRVLRGIVDRKLGEPITHGKRCFRARQEED